MQDRVGHGTRGETQVIHQHLQHGPGTGVNDETQFSLWFPAMQTPYKGKKDVQQVSLCVMLSMQLAADVRSLVFLHHEVKEGPTPRTYSPHGIRRSCSSNIIGRTLQFDLSVWQCPSSLLVFRPPINPRPTCAAWNHSPVYLSMRSSAARGPITFFCDQSKTILWALMIGRCPSTEPCL